MPSDRFQSLADCCPSPRRLRASGVSSTVRTAVVGLACGFCLTTSAAAQPTENSRAAQIEALRRAKAEAIAEAPTPGKVEAAINYV